MADEISVAFDFCRTGTVSHKIPFPTREFDSDDDVCSVGTIVVAYTAEALPLGEITSLGWAVLMNDPGSTGTIQVLAGFGGTAFATLEPGAAMLGPLAAFAPYVKTTVSGEDATLHFHLFSN